VDILKESRTEENETVSNKPRRQFTQEQKAEAVQIVLHTPTVERSSTGKPISQVAKEMGLTESALRKWASPCLTRTVKQAQTDQAKAPHGPLTTEEHQELAKLRRDNKRLQMERDFLKKPPPSLLRRTQVL
jgi:transposase